MRSSTSIFIMVILLTGFLAISCAKDTDDVDPPADAAFSGGFVSADHPTSGNASINEEKTTLTLTSFKTDNGPDLNIYLASDIDHVTADFIDLGDIKGVNGTYTYNLPGQIDFLAYKYVIVWCVAFDVNFGYAEIGPL